MSHWNSSYDRRGGYVSWSSPHEPPHGGRLETAAIAIYIVMILGLIVAWAAKEDHSRPQVPQMSHERELSEIAKANDAANGILSKRNAWTDDELIDVRNRLLVIRDQPGVTMLVRDHAELLLKEAIVNPLQELRDRGDVRRNGNEQFRAMELELKLGQHVPSDPDRKPASYRDFFRFVWRFAKVLLKGYVLFIPFAFVCMLARLAACKRSVADELAFGWRRFLRAGIFWMTGLACYPGDPAKVLRQRRILYEYLARTGKDRDALSPEDHALIEALVLSPKKELQQRLNAIRELSWGAFMKMRMAFYASIVAGYLCAPFSFARAQSSNPDAAAGAGKTPVALAAPPDPAPPFAEVHGFGQLDTPVPGGSSALTRFLLMGNFHPAEHVDATVFFNLTPTPAMMFAELAWRPWGGPVGIRIGQLGLRPAYMVPRPDQGRLMDGPLSEQFIQFMSPGAEIFGDHGPVAWALACVAGTGPNQRDDNRAKDVVASFQLKPWRPMLLEAAVQAGQQPAGFRTTASAHLALQIGKLDLDALGVRGRMEGANIGQGLSSMAAVRASPHVDLAFGHDWLAPADQPPSHTIRGQVTFLAVRDLFRIGMHGFWNSVTGPGGILRLQYGF